MPDQFQGEDILEVCVTDCERTDGSVWVFAGITNDDESRNVKFGVDARIGAAMQQALEIGDGPVAFVMPWQILSTRPTATQEQDRKAQQMQRLGEELTKASDRTHMTLANYAIAKHEHEQNLAGGSTNPMQTATHYRAAEQEMHRAIQNEVDLVVKAHQIGML